MHYQSQVTIVGYRICCTKVKIITVLIIVHTKNEIMKYTNDYAREADIQMTII